jgi:AraC-like DNA-binding protein
MSDIRYRDQYRHCMEQASQYIQDNLSQPLELDAVARAAGFSPFHSPAGRVTLGSARGAFLRL